MVWVEMGLGGGRTHKQGVTESPLCTPPGDKWPLLHRWAKALELHGLKHNQVTPVCQHSNSFLKWGNTCLKWGEQPEGRWEANVWCMVLEEKSLCVQMTVCGQVGASCRTQTVLPIPGHP